MAASQHHAVGPRAHLEGRVTSQSIRLGGRYINARALAEANDLCHSFVTRVLNGERPASVEYYQKIADALGMGLEELLEAIATRRTERTALLRRRLGV